jgi:hypothetical protein
VSARAQDLDDDADDVELVVDDHDARHGSILLA